MSIQTRLALRSARLKRKLFDNKLDKLGTRIGALKVTVSENRYGDITIQSHQASLISGYIKFPGGEVPIFRAVRQNVEGEFYQTQETPASNVSLYDLLPIEGWFPNSEKIERNDILIVRALDSPKGVAPDASGEVYRERWNLWPLQVTEIAGKFNAVMLYTKVKLAPYAFFINDFSGIQKALEELTVFRE